MKGMEISKLFVRAGESMMEIKCDSKNGTKQRLFGDVSEV
jgi:hypothetical protein